MKTTIEIDVNSAKFKMLNDAYKSGGTLTFDYDGRRYTGCRITDVNFSYDERMRATIDIESPEVSTDHRLLRKAMNVAARTAQDSVEDYMRKIMETTPNWAGDLAAVEKRILAQGYGAGRSRFDFETSIPKFVITRKNRQEGKSAMFAYLYGMNPFGPYNFNTGKGKSAMKNWQFKSLHPKDIDFDEIGSALTRKNPLALVHGTGEGGPETYVVIRQSLYDKSLVTAQEPPHGVFKFMTNNGARVFSVALEDFPHWVDWAKAVRGSSWNDEDRRRAKFTVTLPKV